MKCPECDATFFYETSHGSTLMGGGYQEEGHYHDPNYHTRGYVCETGHRFEIYHKVLCPLCGLADGEKTLR